MSDDAWYCHVRYPTFCSILLTSITSCRSAEGWRLAEIDENLIRAELTPAEAAMHTVRRKELYKQIHPKTKQGGAPAKRSGKGGKVAKSAALPPAFAKDTAKKTGQSDRKVRLDATRGNKDVLGTCLDKGEELDALGRWIR